MNLKGRPAAPAIPLLARRLLAQSGQTQAELLRYINARGHSLSPSALSRWLCHQTVMGFEPSDVSPLVIEFVGDSLAAQADPELSTEPEPTHAQLRVAMLQAIPLSYSAREHFKLGDFSLINDVECQADVWFSKSHRKVSEEIYHAARGRKFLAVSGTSGAGKSVLRRDFFDRIKRDKLKIIVITPRTPDKTTLTADHISTAIIAAISNETPRRDREAKALQIERLLVASAEQGWTHTLVFEEAHDLPIRTLKYLKRFAEIESGYKKLLGIILIAEPKIEDMLDIRKQPEALELIQRCELMRLAPISDGLEVMAYLTFKLKRAGIAANTVIDQMACDAIFEGLQVTNGKVKQNMCYPLAVNNAFTLALNEAAENSDARVTAALVRSL